MSNAVEQECCPSFEPEISKWDDKIIEWDNKLFVKDKVFTIFYIPMNFSGVMTRIMQKFSDAKIESPEYLCLSEHTSLWNMDLLVATDKELPNAQNVKLSGKFYSKVYEGEFKDMKKWMEDFTLLSKAKGYNIKRIFNFYTTCPKCAKKYGKNYVVVLGKID